MTTAATVLQHARHLGVDRLDAHLLLAHHWGKTRAWLLANDTVDMPSEVATRVSTDMTARAQGMPLAYLVGHKEFCGLSLAVNTNVLVPRPETEHLVAWALELLQTEWGSHPAPVVVDLGTGSGAVALAVKHACPRAVVHAVDASNAALAVARQNAMALHIDVSFHHGDWWDGGWQRSLPAPPCLVVSNPPYIALGDAHLVALAHEPQSALVAGPNGMDDIKTIVGGAAKHMPAGAWLLMEHGNTQGPTVCALLAQHQWVGIETVNDLAAQPRCSGGKRPAFAGPAAP